MKQFTLRMVGAVVILLVSTSVIHAQSVNDKTAQSTPSTRGIEKRDTPEDRKARREKAYETAKTVGKLTAKGIKKGASLPKTLATELLKPKVAKAPAPGEE